MTYPSNSVTETLISAIEAVGGATPKSFGLGELLRDFDNALAGFSGGLSNPAQGIYYLGDFMEPVNFSNPLTDPAYLFNTLYNAVLAASNLTMTYNDLGPSDRLPLKTTGLASFIWPVGVFPVGWSGVSLPCLQSGMDSYGVAGKYGTVLQCCGPVFTDPSVVGAVSGQGLSIFCALNGVGSDTTGVGLGQFSPVHIGAGWHDITVDGFHAKAGTAGFGVIGGEGWDALLSSQYFGACISPFSVVEATAAGGSLNPGDYSIVISPSPSPYLDWYAHPGMTAQPGYGQCSSEWQVVVGSPNNAIEVELPFQQLGGGPFTTLPGTTLLPYWGFDIWVGNPGEVSTMGLVAQNVPANTTYTILSDTAPLNFNPNQTQSIGVSINRFAPGSVWTERHNLRGNITNCSIAVFAGGNYNSGNTSVTSFEYNELDFWLTMPPGSTVLLATYGAWFGHCNIQLRGAVSLANWNVPSNISRNVVFDLIEGAGIGDAGLAYPGRVNVMIEQLDDPTTNPWAAQILGSPITNDFGTFYINDNQGSFFAACSGDHLNFSSNTLFAPAKFASGTTPADIPPTTFSYAGTMSGDQVLQFVGGYSSAGITAPPRTFSMQNYTG